MWTILCGVIDGEINTREQAAAIMDEETRAYAETLHITEEAARQQLKDDIGYASWYYSAAQAEKIMELFDTQHPVYGRHRPTPEEAVRLSNEHIERTMKERENVGIDTQEKTLP